MKTSRTNSFRLHRVSRASSLKKQSQTFYLPDQTFKLSAINSVTKGVKNSELSFITGDDLNKLRVQPLVTADSFYQSAHSNLTEVRKKYDEAKKQRVYADQNIIKLKADIKKYKTFQQQYLDKLKQGRSQVNNLQENLKLKKDLVDQTIIQKKVLLSMRHRLKFDKVVYDQKKFDLNKEYSFQNKQLDVLKKDGFYAGQQCDRAQKIYDQFLQQLNEQGLEREEHLKNLQDMIRQKKESNEHNLNRQQQIYQIAERALQDKNPSEKQWHHIYLTNIFISKMLRNKIEKQMQKFSIVEFAFKNIKTATGVSDAKTLVSKYLNKQSQYGGLLGRITVNQKKISKLKQQRDFLLAQHKQLEIEKQTLQNVRPKNLDISTQLKNFGLVSEDERKMETLMSKISSWLAKQIKKINAIEKSAINFSESKKKGVVKNNFAQFCQIINSLLEKCDKKDISDADTTPGDISARDSARVTRVMPRRSRKNSKGQQIFDVDDEDLPLANQYQQKEILNSQRYQILQSNQKFMKEARKRLQQKRKLTAQKQVGGQKKQKKPEVKKQQD